MFFSKRVLTDERFVPMSKDKEAYERASIAFKHFDSNKLWYVDDPNVPHVTFDDKYVFAIAKNFVRLELRTKPINYSVYTLPTGNVVRMGFEYKPLIYHPFIGGLTNQVTPTTPVKTSIKDKTLEPILTNFCIMITGIGKYIYMTEQNYPTNTRRSEAMNCSDALDYIKDKFKLDCKLQKSHDCKISELLIQKVMV